MKNSNGITSIYKENMNALIPISKKNKININMLVNYCVSKYMPTLIREMENKDNDLVRVADLTKRLGKRRLIIELKKEQKRRMYFLGNFTSDWKKMLNKNFDSEELKKQELIKFLSLNIKESETYTNNEEITTSLKQYLHNIKTKNITTVELRNHFDFSLTKMENNKIIEGDVKQ